MNRLSISYRLTLIIGLLVALLITIGGFGVYGMREANTGFRMLYQDRMVALADLLEVQRLLLRNRGAVSRAVAINDPEITIKLADSISENAKQLDLAWKDFMATNLHPDEKYIANKFENERDIFRDKFLFPAQHAMRAGDINEVRKLLIELDENLYEPLRDSIVKLTDFQSKVGEIEYLSSQATYRKILFLSVSMIVIGITSGAILGFNLIRNLKHGFNQAMQTADAIAVGDLTRNIDVHGNDEIATLLKTLKKMQSSLQDVVNSVHSGSGSVASASTQIAQGNQDLSARTERQASALEETAASMEQLNVTVRQNADNALQANELAINASSVAARGGEVVTKVVKTIENISESSKKIADIIQVIDSIAFQTNILALNAAVEAARAGEQGRGFAVVASEVRVLAQRSASAAKEIKNLIMDSVACVEEGSALAVEAGVTMNEVVTSIRHVTQIVGEISSASNEQSAGVNQVGEAITQMDQVTQQNAALVEEMAAAASSLNNQATDLVKVVSAFKINKREIISDPSEFHKEIISPEGVVAQIARQ